MDSKDKKHSTEGSGTLDALNPGEEAIITGYNEEMAGELRVLEMGLIIGTVVRFVKHAPFGDPIQIRIRGADLSLRKKMARGIFTQRRTR